MSVFGGDSWAREAQYRKRRVDDLIIEGLDASAFRKLPGGKFLCLICSQRPVLDTPLTLSAHLKGSRHEAAEAKMKDRELSRKNEINKRIALTDSCATGTSGTRAHRPALIEQAQKAASYILGSGSAPYTPTLQESPDARSNACHYREIPSAQKSISLEVARAPEQDLDHQLDPRVRRERELKFTAAGWKRDGYGRWFKDENVEFDSDEEDPNVCLW